MPTEELQPIQRAKRVPFGRYTSIWSENELRLGFAQLEMIAPFTSTEIDIVKKQIVVGGYPLQTSLSYWSPNTQNPEDAFFPLREQTTFEIEFTEDGRQRIKNTPLHFFISPASDTDVDCTGRFLYRMAFANRRTVTGLFVADELGDTYQRRLFTEGKNELFLPNIPSLVAATRIQFQKSH